jgi:hypothetical protein
VRVDRQAILARVAALPIERWSYKADGPGIRHIGPMAQDFAAAFRVGADDRHIHMLDAGGVALAVIQGLHGLVRAQAAELGALSREVATLRATQRAEPPVADRFRGASRGPRAERRGAPSRRVRSAVSHTGAR